VAAAGLTQVVRSAQQQVVQEVPIAGEKQRHRLERPQGPLVARQQVALEGLRLVELSAEPLEMQWVQRPVTLQVAPLAELSAEQRRGRQLVQRQVELSVEPRAEPLEEQLAAQEEVPSVEPLVEPAEVGRGLRQVEQPGEETEAATRHPLQRENLQWAAIKRPSKRTRKMRQGRRAWCELQYSDSTAERNYSHCSWSKGVQSL
jgi:hypothetical protein